MPIHGRSPAIWRQRGVASACPVHSRYGYVLPASATPNLPPEQHIKRSLNVRACEVVRVGPEDTTPRDLAPSSGPQPPTAPCARHAYVPSPESRLPCSTPLPCNLRYAMLSSWCIPAHAPELLRPRMDRVVAAPRHPQLCVAPCRGQAKVGQMPSHISAAAVASTVINFQHQRWQRYAASHDSRTRPDPTLAPCCAAFFCNVVVARTVRRNHTQTTPARAAGVEATHGCASGLRAAADEPGGPMSVRQLADVVFPVAMLDEALTTLPSDWADIAAPCKWNKSNNYVAECLQARGSSDYNLARLDHDSGDCICCKRDLTRRGAAAVRWAQSSRRRGCAGRMCTRAMPSGTGAQPRCRVRWQCRDAPPLHLPGAAIPSRPRTSRTRARPPQHRRRRQQPASRPRHPPLPRVPHASPIARGHHHCRGSCRGSCRRGRGSHALPENSSRPRERRLVARRG